MAVVLVVAAGALPLSAAGPDAASNSPWDLESLSRPPAMEWLDQESPIRSLTYRGEPYKGFPTDVFAFYATPGTIANDPSQDKNLPAVVLVHGGGGTAFAEWVWLWAKRGYAAIAMDLSGRRPPAPQFDEATGQLVVPRDQRKLQRQRLARGGPEQGHPEKFDSVGGDRQDDWPYHAVANVIRAHSLIRGFAEVDARRTAVTGISWGGYTTCLVASIDHRFKAAVPVYGCGFLFEGESVQKPAIDRLETERRQQWIRLYDPSSHLGKCRLPILFVNGTNDINYPLDSYARSYQLVQGPRQIRIEVNMAHSHVAGWKPEEIGLFIDHHLRGGVALPSLGRPQLEDDRVTVQVESQLPPTQAALHFTTDDGRLAERTWQHLPAQVSNGCIIAPKPPPDATLWLLSVTDQRGAMVSTEVMFAQPVYDVVVYGGTSAGVAAAVQSARMGKSVIVVCPDKHLGGLSSGGLGWTDSGDKSAIGGIAREFYHRVWKHYQKPEAWRWQRREDYGNRGQGTAAIDAGMGTMWIFEPHVAEQVFLDLLAEHNITVKRDEWLDRQQGVVVQGNRIKSIATTSGRKYRGRMFIDATYEGDLMAAAGVSYHVGREANSTYAENYNGVQTGVLHHKHHFGVLDKGISPYVVPGDPSSGVLPRTSAQPPGEYGRGDRRIQAYCFRMCLTDHADNRLPFPKPDGYDPKQYELLLRIFDAGWRETFGKFDPIPNGKTDTNNHGPMSTDNIGYNYDYPEASYQRRREIIAEHETYQKGWLYFIANDPRVPPEVQQEMRRWGLAKDEFVDNGNWPHQIYVREARRMQGRYVMTEHDCLDRKTTPDSVGMGSYTIDSHNVQRYITPEGYVQNEGDIGVGTPRPYEIAYGSLTPRKDECENLLVPVCVSSSHIAFGSIRMEPVFMILGQSAATAAALSIDQNVAVQDLAYEQLRKRLLADKQVLELPASAATPAKD